MGAVHDFGALVTSVKEKGRSIADIASITISNRARIMFLIFVMLLVWLVLAVFAMAIADLFVSVPSSVIPINVQIVVALIMGIFLKRKNVSGFLAIALAAINIFGGFLVTQRMLAMYKKKKKGKNVKPFSFAYCHSSMY